MWATSEIPQATKRPSASAAPATWVHASGASVPQTWLTFTPTFSNTAPRITRASPPPCSRCPAGFSQLRGAKRLSGSNASNAAQKRACRSRKYATAGTAKFSALLMHEVHEARDGVGVRIGPDAVSEVEDMTGRIPGRRDNGGGGPRELRGRREQRRGIEVPLHGLARPEYAPHLAQR